MYLKVHLGTPRFKVEMVKVFDIRHYTTASAIPSYPGRVGVGQAGMTH